MTVGQHDQPEARRSAAPIAGRVAFLAGALLLGAPQHAAVAYNCSSTPWQAISVVLSNNLTLATTSYAISTTVPALDGCDLTTNSTVTVVLPEDTDASTVSGGTLNGNAITTSFTHFGQTVSFKSPVAVANNTAVDIVLITVTNPSLPGGKTLTLGATGTQSGGPIGTTVSGTYTLVQPSPTPSRTPSLTGTPTLTATRTPTLTGTPTNTFPTATPTQSATLTPTPGLCTSAGGVNPCGRGGGPKNRDCYMEWAVTPVPVPDRGGFPKNKQVCYEGDPICDADANLGNNSCTFRAKLCINNHDPRLACTPAGLRTFEVKSPNPSHLRDSADSANLSALESQAGASSLGVTVVRKLTQVYVGTTNLQGDACAATMDLQVPLRVSATGKASRSTRRLSIIGIAGDGTKDKDGLSLQCRPSTCGDGIIQADHETCDDGNRNNFDGCDQGCHIELPTPTPSLTATSTYTATIAGPSATPTNTPLASSTPTVTATATVTATQGAASCGNGTVEAGEDCDDGGICVGGTNAGTTCTAEAQCAGNGICNGGLKIGVVCGGDVDCGSGGTCVRCKTFGGDGCAANCTAETIVPYPLVPGNVNNQQTTSTAFVAGEVLNLPLLLSGSQQLTIGKERNGQIPVVVKVSSIVLPAIRVGTLACACVRGIEARSCGGSLFDLGGTTLSEDCTFVDSCIADGKPPCVAIHGAGNTSSGAIGCTGLAGTDFSFIQDAGGTPEPPPPTPPAGSGQPVITLSSSGGPGSALMLNTLRIGNAQPPAPQNNPCVVTAGVKPEVYGADGRFCNADDPDTITARGSANTLPASTGTATARIDNHYYPTTMNTGTLGPLTRTGAPFNCANLTAPTPSASGAHIVGAFTSLNQPALGDIVVTNGLIAQ